LNNFSKKPDSNNKDIPVDKKDKSAGLSREKLSGGSSDEPPLSASKMHVPASAKPVNPLNIHKPVKILDSLNINKTNKFTVSPDTKKQGNTLSSEDIQKTGKPDKTGEIRDSSDSHKIEKPVIPFNTKKLENPLKSLKSQNPDNPLNALNILNLKKPEKPVILPKTEKPEKSANSPGARKQEVSAQPSPVQKPDKPQMPDIPQSSGTHIQDKTANPATSKIQEKAPERLDVSDCNSPTTPLRAEKTTVPIISSRFQKFEESLHSFTLKEQEQKEVPAEIEIIEEKPRHPKTAIKSVTARFGPAPGTQRFFEIETYSAEEYRDIDNPSKTQDFKSIVVFVLTMTIVVFLLFSYLNSVSRQVEGDSMKLNVERRPDGRIVMEEKQAEISETEDHTEEDIFKSLVIPSPVNTPMVILPTLTEEEKKKRDEEIKRDLDLQFEEEFLK
jgi:hypothetical protein